MGAVLSFLSTRAGGIVAMVLGGLLAAGVGVQTLRLAWSETEVAEKDAKIEQQKQDIEKQNAAVEKMRADAMAQSQAADARARDKLKPRPKPDTATVEALNRWLGNP